MGRCISVDEGIGRGDEVSWRKASGRVSSFGSSEEKNVRLGFMQLVVDPTSGLLNSERSPFLNNLLGTCSVRMRFLGILR